MHRGISPLAVPFYLGWARLVFHLTMRILAIDLIYMMYVFNRHVSKDGTKISYITPCGVKLDYYEQILGYNLGTKNQIPIECFALEATIDCLNRFSAARTIASIPVRNCLFFCYPNSSLFSCSEHRSIILCRTYLRARNGPQYSASIL